MGNIIICECFRKEKKQDKNVYDSKITLQTKIQTPLRESQINTLKTTTEKNKVINSEPILNYNDPDSEDIQCDTSLDKGYTSTQYDIYSDYDNKETHTDKIINTEKFFENKSSYYDISKNKKRKRKYRKKLINLKNRNNIDNTIIRKYKKKINNLNKIIYK